MVVRFKVVISLTSQTAKVLVCVLNVWFRFSTKRREVSPDESLVLKFVPAILSNHFPVAASNSLVNPPAEIVGILVSV